ncbi:MAG: tRNA pseudouridine(55) synthase TruB [Rhizobiales bacterium]|nr:tRNA pseudouridine(55) synthase TruB [Hyphomicrobiales bacterium]
MARRKKGKAINGWLALDKPEEMTSTAALGAVKRLFDAAKAGHGGTLDPLASGLLPIAFGEATKTVSFLVDSLKVYRFTVAWGHETDTDDREGAVTASSDNRPGDAEIRAALGQFTGHILQVPPRFSAKKIKGQRAYDLAREGIEPELEAREVHIKSLRIVEQNLPERTAFEAICGKGTYVRAIARDLGRALGTFAHVVALRRTHVGPFGPDTMISLDRLEEISHSAAGCEALKAELHPVTTVLDDIPALAVSQGEAAKLRSGQPIILRGRDAPVNCGAAYAVCQGSLVALGEVERGELHPTRVFKLSL